MIIFENVQFCLVEYCSQFLQQSVSRKWGQYWHTNRADDSGILHAPVGYCAEGIWI